jgi:bacillithiol biosynthesis cysteine-adding enzyme BshC
MTRTTEPGLVELRVLATPVAGPVPDLSPRSDPPDASRLGNALLPSDAADRLRLPGALAVTTGQQPGLFGGPMYVVHKALAARALARCLEQRWERPVVPVFWLAGDDHDWEEATRTAWWTPAGEVVEWALHPRPAQAPQRAMSAESLPPDVSTARDRLADDLPPGPERDAALAWVDRHWRTGATLHSAFAAAITELLAPLGIATLDATSTGFKQAQQPLIRDALVRSNELDAALAALPAQDAWVGAGEGLTLVFLEASAGRDRLMRDGDRFRTRRSGEVFSEAELLELLEREPGRFSANVLLRPVIEAALVPTVAYVAGPGEFRYLTRQASALYPVLQVHPQAAVPRWGGAVIDAVTSRLLSRLGLDAHEVMRDDGTLGREVMRRDLPGRIPAAIEQLRAAVEDAASELSAAGASIDAVLDRAVESRRRRLQFVIEDLERLMLRHHRKRGDIAWSQYLRVRSRLMPLDRSQERVVGVAAALGRWGHAWIDAAAQSADSWAERALGGVESPA